MCAICNLNGREKLSKIRFDLSSTMSFIDISKLEKDEKSLLDEFRSYAALLFSDLSGYSSDFSPIHALHLSKLMSELKNIASNGISDISLSVAVSTQLSSNLVDLELEMTRLIETGSLRTARGFTCREEQCETEQTAK